MRGVPRGRWMRLIDATLRRVLPLYIGKESVPPGGSREKIFPGAKSRNGVGGGRRSTIRSGLKQNFMLPGRKRYVGAKAMGPKERGFGVWMIPEAKHIPIHCTSLHRT